MSDLLIRLRDASRLPLEDTVDVSVLSPRSGAIVRQKKDHQGTKSLRMTGLTPGDPYIVRVRPVRHRPVQLFVRAPPDGSEPVELFCPVDPTRVTDVSFPAYADLPAPARQVLEATRLQHPPGGVSGEALYASAELDRVPKAGLLNLLAKMARTPLPGGSSVLEHVDSLYRLRGDRVFANVSTALRDLVRTGVGAQMFRLVSGSLHKPDAGFELVDSYKTPEPYGNLQVTFFAGANPLRFTADIDIDDAAGIAHVFQVVEHAVTAGVTHPYDIHEILVFHQLLDPGYRLLT